MIHSDSLDQKYFDCRVYVAPKVLKSAFSRNRFGGSCKYCSGTPLDGLRKTTQNLLTDRPPVTRPTF